MPGVAALCMTCMIICCEATYVWGLWLLRMYSNHEGEVTGVEQCQAATRDSSLCMVRLPKDSENELSGGVGGPRC